MEKQALLGILIGILIGTGSTYVILSNQHNEVVDMLQTQIQDQTLTVNTLREDYDSLEEDYEKLDDRYSSLQTSYGRINSENEAIKSEMKSITDNLQEYQNILDSIVNLEDSFPRVINIEEQNEIMDLVYDLTDNSGDKWKNYQYLWNYAVSNIKYSEDNEICILEDISEHGFEIGYVKNYVQTPAQTLDRGMGDAEDQAILFFTLIKAYWRNVYGFTYDLYLTEIKFYDDTVHYAVFLPVVDGFVCIFDPTEGYLTNNWGNIADKYATTELTNYNTIWGERHDIKSLKLYSINDYYGTFSVAFEGTLSETIAFLSQD